MAGAGEREGILAKDGRDGKGATLAVILAGGAGRRMGGADKAAIRLAGRPLLSHVMARLGPQVAAMVLSANGDPGRFAAFGLPVLTDPLPDRPGPLAGILAALGWAQERWPEIADLLVVPVDTPFLPGDLRARLDAARRAAGRLMAIAASAGRPHPTVALLPVDPALADDLAARLARGERRVGDFFARHQAAIADYGRPFPDPFRNLNTPADLAAAEAALDRPDAGDPMPARGQTERPHEKPFAETDSRDKPWRRE